MIQVEHQDIWVTIWIVLIAYVFLAPEVMCRQNHGVAVDYFALGIMAYEFMMGRVKNIFPLNLNIVIETLSW